VTAPDDTAALAAAVVLALMVAGVALAALLDRWRR
jgi:hypothetical protein